jgi:hypothetical protein
LTGERHPHSELYPEEFAAWCLREYACVCAILAPTVTAWLLTIALDFTFLAEITCCCDTIKSTTLFGWFGAISDHVVDGVKREQSGAVGWLYMTSVVAE